MMHEIIEELSRKTEKAGGSYAVFPDGKHKPIAFSEENFRQIGAAIDRRCAYIDGGNAELLASAGLSLQIIRNGCVIIDKNKVSETKKREFYALATEENINGRKQAIAKIYSEGDHGLEIKGEGEILKLCDSVRRSSEISFACEIIKELERGSMIVLDGTLEEASDIEKNHIDTLYHEAGKRGVIVCALAKTSSLLTERGTPYSSMLMSKKEGSWYYCPVAQPETEMHPAEIAFAKLNDKSRHAFRVEIYSKQKEKMGYAMAVLKENSRDLSFPGYPYGLIMADRIARVGNHEKGYLSAKISALLGVKLSGLMASMDAHSILDSM